MKSDHISDNSFIQDGICIATRLVSDLISWKAFLESAIRFQWIAPFFVDNALTPCILIKQQLETCTVHTKTKFDNYTSAMNVAIARLRRVESDIGFLFAGLNFIFIMHEYSKQIRDLDKLLLSSPQEVFNRWDFHIVKLSNEFGTSIFFFSFFIRFCGIQWS